MERKIGEIFEFAGLMLQVEEAKNGSCDGCYFSDKKCFEKRTGECVDDFRSDNTDVIFKDITDEETK
ncbi:hypothetical protein [Bacteroides sp.]|uniref:hypothetical protein n=1 Tax=Bacteroides sp. TaxID=29523 RepID=UPI0025855BB8|nr:hypothetical protein [Bacteroides sp.]